ncbi:hypothetical protein Q673_06225 [Marinobacter sp. EN3]|uniref:hypothetical protein n=1 Tax=Marinobacter sp. EN3 TaxID=1397533 RepID=UPI0003B92422|nr:hypothetical protein [Marinobacter sp. EN3]ERS04809.1 hypothetical protein Q673_06225 [Marinobacter sp. EN3]
MPRFESAMDGWAELERLQSCRRAIADLMVPEPDLSAVNRDNLCQLLGYLDSQEEEVMAQLQPLLKLTA